MPDRSRYRLVDVADLEDLIEHAERARRLLLSIRGTAMLTALGLAVVDLEYVGRVLVRIAGRRWSFGDGRQERVFARLACTACGGRGTVDLPEIGPCATCGGSGLVPSSGVEA